MAVSSSAERARDGRPKQQRMLERQGHAGEHDAEQRADTGARRVQRAGAAPVAHGVVPLTIAAASQAAAAALRGPSRARRRSGPSAGPRSAPRPRRPRRLVRAGDDPGRLPGPGSASPPPAREPGPSVRDGRRAGRAARTACPPRSAARTRPRPSDPSRAARGRVDAHVRPACRRAVAARPAPRACRASRAADLRARGLEPLGTSRQSRSASSAQSIRIGSFLPCAAVTNGSGNEPTTAGIRIAAPQSWWSHHTRSPGSAAARGALLGLDPVDVVEPVDRPAAAPAARQALDRLHEAAAVARVDRRTSRCSRRITVSPPGTSWLAVARPVARRSRARR